jgi:predicted transcriptional regulator
MTDAKTPSSRHAVLDLAPLELACMNMLWPMGQGTVREIREALAPRRPRAYTTIMTIMDRLARKGVVERHKTGRAYIYRPNLSAESARGQALAQVIESFFGGSKESLLAYLDGGQPKAPAIAGVVANAAVNSAAPVAASTSAAGAGSTAAPPAGSSSIK